MRIENDGEEEECPAEEETPEIDIEEILRRERPPEENARRLAEVTAKEGVRRLVEHDSRAERSTSRAERSTKQEQF